jgi:hypothetical protein
MRRFAAAILLGAAAAPAQTVKTIVNNGPTPGLYDVVILGDGYRAAEQAKFDADCLTFTAGMFGKEPYKTFAGYFNVHTVFRASVESGADHPDANPPIVRNTAYDATYNYGGTGRCLYIRNTSLALQDAALAPANEGRVLVMVNDPRYGGCASTFAVSYNGSSMVEVQVHEVGHAIGGVADEYDYPNGTYSGPEPGQANITTSPVGQKWSHWHGFDGISAFEGAGYHLRGLFRPRIDCLMRSLGQKICAVCGEQKILRLHERATSIQDPQPATLVVPARRGDKKTFSIRSIAPIGNAPTITWRVDDDVRATGVSSLTIDTAPMSAGNYRVTVEVLDRTAQVRVDTRGLLKKTNAWLLGVTEPLPDLTPTALQPSVPAFAAGTRIDLATTVQNVGQAAAGPFRVEHFLSPDPLLGADDVYLGGVDVAGLAVDASQPLPRSSVAIPAHLAPGTWTLGAWIDRTGQVAEANEMNNLRLATVTVTAPDCGSRLEFSDPLLYPHDAGTLQPGAPGAKLSPIVTSRCRAGAHALILWGGSGTSPGVQLAPGITLALNPDALTWFGLERLGAPWFVGFFGTLDARGIRAATMTLPSPGAPIQLDTHLAAVIVSSDLTTWLAATNPVLVRLR